MDIFWHCDNEAFVFWLQGGILLYGLECAVMGKKNFQMNDSKLRLSNYWIN